MGRILALDYGTKRTGIAVTDPLQIIASGLDTVATDHLIPYLERYLATEEVTTIVIGEPRHTDGSPTKLVSHIVGLERRLRQLFPQVAVVMQDEQFTSRRATEIIRQVGVKQKKRRDKALVDRVAATLILQEYLEENKYRT